MSSDAIFLLQKAAHITGQHCTATGIASSADPATERPVALNLLYRPLFPLFFLSLSFTTHSMASASFPSVTRSGASGERMWSFWQHTLSGGRLPPLSLPTDRRRPSVMSLQCSSLSVSVSPSITSQLCLLAETQGVDMFQLLLACFQASFSFLSVFQLSFPFDMVVTHTWRILCLFSITPRCTAVLACDFVFCG